uniref:Transposase Tc1-like domain-containing protein n=1 Tax=Scleropages formosus TaxID=113540 RepID=A0A8C9R781_SCLFO
MPCRPCQELKTLIEGLHKDGKGYREIGDQLKISLNSVSVVMRWYKTSRSTAHQSPSGCLPKMTPRTMRYLHNLALKNRWQVLGKGLSTEIEVSVTAQTVRRTLHNVNLYDGVQGGENKKPCLTRRCLINTGSTFFVKRGGGSVMRWGCMSAKGDGEMTLIDGTMNAYGYTEILYGIAPLWLLCSQGYSH